MVQEQVQAQKLVPALERVVVPVRVLVPGLVQVQAAAQALGPVPLLPEVQLELRFGLYQLLTKVLRIPGLRAETSTA